MTTGLRSFNYQIRPAAYVVKSECPCFFSSAFESLRLSLFGLRLFAFCTARKTTAPFTVELIKEFTGASKVIFFDHTIRRHRPDVHEESPDKRQPVCQAVARVYRHLPEKEVHELLKHRFHILDLWRPISHAAYEWPLGFGDSSTVNPATELMEMTLEFPGGPGETYGVEHNPNHKWKYLRGMEPDECVLFKWSEGVTTFNAHTGFVGPSTPVGVPHRESIEMRALVFYV
ncbi:hypothetical protein B0H14DRAFT_2385704 [Mycena olivaceomarginata]|nr:hypothetical protein B0H14DRAFT_2385704 [Mycena olivaceomarginata]